MRQVDSHLAHSALVAIAGNAAALAISANCSSSVLAPHSA